MEDQLRRMLGRWVLILTGGVTGITGNGQLCVGVLEDADPTFYYLRKPDGELLCIPAASVRQVQQIEQPPPDPSERLLRPSGPDDARRMVRPADGPAGARAAELVRPAARLRPRRKDR